MGCEQAKLRCAEADDLQAECTRGNGPEGSNFSESASYGKGCAAGDVFLYITERECIPVAGHAVIVFKLDEEECIAVHVTGRCKQGVKGCFSCEWDHKVKVERMHWHVDGERGLAKKKRLYKVGRVQDTSACGGDDCSESQMIMGFIDDFEEEMRKAKPAHAPTCCMNCRTAVDAAVREMVNSASPRMILQPEIEQLYKMSKPENCTMFSNSQGPSLIMVVDYLVSLHENSFARLTAAIQAGGPDPIKSVEQITQSLGLTPAFLILAEHGWGNVSAYAFLNEKNAEAAIKEASDSCILYEVSENGLIEKLPGGRSHAHNTLRAVAARQELFNCFRSDIMTPSAAGESDHKDEFGGTFLSTSTHCSGTEGESD